MALMSHVLRVFAPLLTKATCWCLVTLCAAQQDLWIVRSCIAEEPTDVLPADSRLSDLQSPSEFFGFALGSRHLRHDQVVDYFQYLSDNSSRAKIGRAHV